MANNSFSVMTLMMAACLVALATGLRYNFESDLSVGKGIPLRIMVLGASICKGEKSNGTVGFRKPLRHSLVTNGNPVNMVGSVRIGQMKDNDVEAHSGNRVDQVTVWANKSVPASRPNLCIINVGTNDCLQHWDQTSFHTRYYSFVQQLLSESPKTAILMSTLLTNTVRGIEPCVLNLNTQIRSLATQLKQEKKPVVLAEMHYQFVPKGDKLPRPTPADISDDGTHPHDAGYKMMADVFLQSIRDIDKKGFFQTADDVGLPDDGNIGRLVQQHKLHNDPDQEMTSKMTGETDKGITCWLT